MCGDKREAPGRDAAGPYGVALTALRDGRIGLGTAR
jgi:hypothetical protein